MREAERPHAVSHITAILLPAVLLAAVLLAALLLANATHAPAASPPGFPSAPQGASAAAKSQPPALPHGKKLILTDGTYQLVREYQRDGDHVRYYSVERSAWEEIPASLVDWPATEQAQAQEAAAEKALDKKLADADRTARLAGIDSDRSFEAKPGVILPDSAGLYSIDGVQVQALQQDLAVSRVDKVRAAEKIASGIPLIRSKASIEIRPKRAKLRIPAGEVEFYFRTSDGREPRLELLRAEVQADRRKLDTISTDVVGQNSYKGNEIPLMISDAARGLYRFTLDQTLMPGEYALVELTAEGDVDLNIWDFGVDMASRSGPLLQ